MKKVRDLMTDWWIWMNSHTWKPFHREKELYDNSTLEIEGEKK